jgi:hypothetical protein
MSARDDPNHFGAPPTLTHDGALGSLDPASVRSLLRSSRLPEVRMLAQEVLRLQRLVERMELFFSTARRSGLPNVLDVTSRNLAAGLMDSISQEPAVRSAEPLRCPGQRQPQHRPWAADLADKRSLERSQAPANIGTAQEKLFTWKLTPEPGRGSDRWRHSGYRGTVFVRAPDPIQARQLAARRFSGDVHAKSSPWTVRSLVHCMRVDDQIYERIDTISIVYP